MYSREIQRAGAEEGERARERERSRYGERSVRRGKGQQLPM